MEEQKIIEEGLKKNTKKDIICYVGIALLFIMIFIPPVFRVVFYDSSVNRETVEVVYLDLVCTKSIFREGKKVTTKINNNYRDSIILKSVVEFLYEGVEDEIDMPEVNEFLSINAEGIKKEKTTSGYIFTFDYVNYPLKDLPELEEYKRPAPAQINYYKNKNFSCENTSKVVEEERK